MRSFRFPLSITLALMLLWPTIGFAKAKKYQVTGVVTSLTADMIVVQKGDEKWEIDRTADTKVTGELKVGAKVMIEYTMTAADVEVKPADKPK